jgi:peptide/nickel transport system permease protein
MFFYVVRRGISAFVMLFVVSITTFLLFYALPNNPARLACGVRCTPAIIKDISHTLGYDQPLTKQYTAFVSGLFTERKFPDDPVQEKNAPQTIVHCAAPCLGYSYDQSREVTPMIKERLPVTVSIAIVAFIIWMASGILFGILAALRKGTLLDRGIVTLSLIGYSLPTFFIGLLLLNFVSIKWQLWPLPNYVPLTENPIEWLRNLFLPSLTLALIYAATYVRLTRAYMLETLNEDYIRTARAKGVKERVVVGKHGLRAVLTPIVTQAGLDLGILLAGAVITETIFNFNGLGKLSLDSVINLDLAVIVPLVLIAALFIIVSNLIVDLMYAAIDPRVRLI